MEERLKVVANGREIEIEGNKEFLEKIKEGGNFYVVAADYVDICAGCEEDYTRDREDDVTVVDETTKNGNIYLIVGGSVAVYGENDVVEDDEDDEEDHEPVEDQDDEDSEEWNEENRARSSSFKKKLLVACGVIAVLVVAAVLIFNVYLPNKARETLDHYVQTFAEEGAEAVSSDDLEDFRKAYKKVRIYPDDYRVWKFWDRFYRLKAIVEVEKTATDVEFSDEYKEYRHDYIDRYLVDDGMDFTAKRKEVTSLAKKAHDLEEH